MHQTLKSSVIRAIEEYLITLDGMEPTDLYQLVIDEVEAGLLETILKHFKFNRSHTAKILGLSRGTLLKKIALHKIEPENLFEETY